MKLTKRIIYTRNLSNVRRAVLGNEKLATLGNFTAGASYGPVNLRPWQSKRSGNRSFRPVGWAFCKIDTVQGALY